MGFIFIVIFIVIVFRSTVEYFFLGFLGPFVTSQHGAVSGASASASASESG